ncbi:hypothetical protein OGAPHI_000003, partial [Ogataea philodendri]
MTTQETIKPLVDRILNNPLQFRRSTASPNISNKDTDMNGNSDSPYIVIGKRKLTDQNSKNNGKADPNQRQRDENDASEIVQKKRKMPTSVAEALNWYTNAALEDKTPK